jgi:hypothetical protein
LAISERMSSLTSCTGSLRNSGDGERDNDEEREREDQERERDRDREGDWDPSVCVCVCVCFCQRSVPAGRKHVCICVYVRVPAVFFSPFSFPSASGLLLRAARFAPLRERSLGMTCRRRQISCRDAMKCVAPEYFP